MKILTKEFYRQRDKQIHMTFTFIVALIITLSLSMLGTNIVVSYFAGVGVSANIGWAKELRDGEGFGTRDIDDIDADMIGANAGAMTGVILAMLYLFVFMQNF